MTKFVQNSAVTIMAVAMFAVTWGPVVSVPPAHASTIITMPILA